MATYTNIPPSNRGRFSTTPSTPDTPVTITESNASAAIKITGRAFVNAANDVFGAYTVTRYNRSRFIRVSTFTPDRITFLCQAVPGGLGYIGVMVNNVLVSTIHVDNSTAAPHYYTATGLGVGSKTVDILEDFQDRLNQLDTGVDGSAAGTYVTEVILPAGSGGTIARATATTGIAIHGNSHVDGDATNPCSYYGWAGQLRRAANTAGTALVGYVGAGSSTLAGDGPTAAQTATMIHDLWAAMGCSTKKLLMFGHPRNDYAYWSFSGSIQSTPTQIQTYIEAVQTALDVSDAGWTGIYARIPQGTAWGANGGGYTLTNYWTSVAAAAVSGGRTNVTTYDTTTFTGAGLSLSNASHFFEATPNQVHLANAGHDIVFGVARTWYGL